jgi:hypothetical protein
VIHAFNDYGFESLNPKVGTGRPKTFELATRDRIVTIALTPPTSLGEPLTRWSLRRLNGYLERRRVVPRIGVETLRRMLLERNVTYQRTRSWKRSTDPEFELYLVNDSLSVHWTPAIRAWATEHNVELVATYASHLNRIECHFQPLREFVINASDYASHHEVARAFRRYLYRRWPGTSRTVTIRGRPRVAVSSAGT